VDKNFSVFSVPSADPGAPGEVPMSERSADPDSFSSGPFIGVAKNNKKGRLFTPCGGLLLINKNPSRSDNTTKN